MISILRTYKIQMQEEGLGVFLRSIETQKIAPFILMILAGGLLPLAFAPFDQRWIAPLSVWALYEGGHQSTVRRAFCLGWMYGLGFFGIGVSWVYVSIHVYGETPAFLALIFTTIFVAFLALYCAGFLAAYRFLFPVPSTLNRILAFPALWVLFEIFRSWFLTGFPWLILGDTQLEGPLRGWIPLVGTYGVSFCLIAATQALIGMGPALAALWRDQKRGAPIAAAPLLQVRILIGFVVCIGLVGVCLRDHAWTQPQGSVKKVLLVQSNLKPNDKFVMENPVQGAWKAYGELTRQQAVDVDWVVWPENSISLPFPYAKPFIDALDAWAKERNFTLMVGLPVKKPNDSHHFYNAIMALGKGSGVYYKKRLVPFGEYVPFENQLRGLFHFFDLPMSAFVAGPETQGIQAPGTQILPLICYEMVYPEFVRKNLQQQAGVLLNVSEDGWFGHSIGPKQHLHMARMRALETGRPVIRSTPSGISAIIDPLGRVVVQTKTDEATAQKGVWQDHQGRTPWMVLGLGGVLFVCVAFLLLCWGAQRIPIAIEF